MIWKRAILALLVMAIVGGFVGCLLTLAFGTLIGTIAAAVFGGLLAFVVVDVSYSWVHGR